MSEKIDVLQERAARMGALKDQDGWQELRDELERKKKRQLNAVAAKVMASSQPVDQRQIDWFRGFWAGCDWLLANPEMAETTLENALKRAQTRELTSV